MAAGANPQWIARTHYDSNSLARVRIFGAVLNGMTMPSERPRHRMMEQWHPLGPVGVITAFNFPNAVWGWNAMLAAVCGDVTIWKPSLLAPLTLVEGEIERGIDAVRANRLHEHRRGLDIEGALKAARRLDADDRDDRQGRAHDDRHELRIEQVGVDEGDIGRGKAGVEIGGRPLRIEMTGRDAELAQDGLERLRIAILSHHQERAATAEILDGPLAHLTTLRWAGRAPRSWRTSSQMR